MENLDEIRDVSDENEESDSGDSLFITQKPIPLPVRSTSLPRLSHRSTPISPRLQESASSSEDEDVPKKRNKPLPLPRFKFPFLTQRKSKFAGDGTLCVAENRAIHYFGMAGFFKCAERENEPSFQSTLPTVDSGTEDITPITEDDKSDEEDVKIIDKRLFVYSVKPTITKCSQPWFRSLRNNTPQCSQKTKSTPLRHFQKERKSQSTSKKSDILTPNLENSPERSDSDATLIEEDELPPSTSKNANKSQNDSCTPELSVKSNEICPSVKPRLDFSTLEESDNTESQSILQYNPMNTRGSSQDNVSSQSVLHQSTQKKHKSKMKHRDNGNQETVLSQDGVYLNTNQNKNKSLSKNYKNRLKTKNKDGAGRLHDVNNDLETTLVGEPLPVATSTQQEVIEKGNPEDTRLPSLSNIEDWNDNDVTVQENNKTICDLRSIENDSNCLSKDLLENGKANSLLSQSKQSHEPDEVDISSKDIDSAEIRNHKTGKTTLVTKPTSMNSIQSIHEGNKLPSCPNDDVFNDDTIVQKKKKKKKHKTKNAGLGNLENENNISTSEPLPLIEQMDNFAGMEREASNMSDSKRNKHKKKRKADFEQVFTLEKSQSNNTDKDFSSKSVEDRGTCKLAVDSATDFTATQNDDSASVRKKKKKVCALADTVRNTNVLFSDKLNNSANDVDSAEINDADDATIQKKKKKKKKKHLDLENDENGTSSLKLDSQEMLNNNGQPDDLGKRKKKKQKRDHSDCNDEQDVVSDNIQLKIKNSHVLPRFVESQDELVDNSAVDTTDLIDTQRDASLSVRKKKRKEKKMLMPQSSESQESLHLVDTNQHKSKTLSKNDKNRLKTKIKDGAGRLRDANIGLETTLVGEPLPVATSTQQEVIKESVNEETGLPSWSNVEDWNNDDYVAVQENNKEICNLKSTENCLGIDPLNPLLSQAKQKKKKKEKRKDVDLENDENVSLQLDPSEMCNTGQTDDNGKRKKKKKKKVHGDCHDEQDNEQLKNVTKNRFAKDELVDNSATDFITTQRDESLSVRKKKMKVSSVEETVENANLPLSQSKPSHGAQRLCISTNNHDSAESNRLLQGTEVGIKLKKKKKKRREDDETDNLDTNGKTSDMTDMSGFKKSMDSGSADVAHSGESDYVKKKKKSKQKSHSPDIDMTTQRQAEEIVEDSAILSPKSSKRKKKKSSHGGEDVIVNSEETEMEQTIEKRKKK